MHVTQTQALLSSRPCACSGDGEDECPPARTSHDFRCHLIWVSLLPRHLSARSVAHSLMHLCTRCMCTEGLPVPGRRQMLHGAHQSTLFKSTMLNSSRACAPGEWQGVRNRLGLLCSGKRPRQSPSPPHGAETRLTGMPLFACDKATHRPSKVPLCSEKISWTDGPPGPCSRMASS